MNKELYTVAEAAEILSLSERTIENLIAKGFLASAIAPGTERSRRISRAMLEQYLRDFNTQIPGFGASYAEPLPKPKRRQR